MAKLIELPSTKESVRLWHLADKGGQWYILAWETSRKYVHVTRYWLHVNQGIHPIQSFLEPSIVFRPNVDHTEEYVMERMKEFITYILLVELDD